MSEWFQDIRVMNYQDSSEYGVTYPERKKSWVTLHRHESMDNIINTMNHEALHMAIRDDMGCDLDEMKHMDGEEEHELMKRIIWCVNDWVF